MASIAKETNGNRRILFVAPDGSRKTIRLGKVSGRDAEAVKYRVEQLLAAKLTGNSIDGDTARWVGELSDSLADKLARVGLIEGREPAPTNTLGQFVADYIDQHGPTVKPATLTTWRQCRRLLLEHFDSATPLQSITEGHAIGYRTYLLTRGNGRRNDKRKLSEATIRKRCACARQFFEHAVRLQLIERNPFNSKRIPTSLPKPAQKEFVEAELSHKILAEMPGPQWRLLFALARWGGVRVPSEPAKLTWADVDWANSRLTIHSPKTEHHEGHEKRVIPIFPELLQPLQEVWEAAQEGDLYVLPILQERTGAALRKPLIAAIEAAGGTQWKKLWVSLRATRDTELRETFPVHVVESWLGHEDRVAKRNYTQVTDAHFGRAATETSDKKSGAESGAVSARLGSQGVATQKTKPGNCRALPHSAIVYEPTGGDDRNRTCTPFGTRS